MKFIKRHWLLFLSLLLILPSIWPLFKPGFFRMHDWLHVARLGQLDLMLKAGQFPPRWAPDFGWGYGMPLLHFYAPLPYYLAEVFYLLGLSAIASIKLVFALNFIAGFYFMYLWAKSYWGQFGALIAATSFVYLPYRAVDFYVRGTLGELTAMTFLPLFFYAASQFIHHKKSSHLLILILALSGIFLSHNPVALFSLFFLPLYCLWELVFIIKRQRKKLVLPIKTGFQLILAGLLALAGSVFFLLPAFFEKHYTTVTKINSGFFHHSFHFIYLRQLFSRFWGYGGSILGPEDDIAFQLGTPQVFLAALALIVFIRALIKKNLKYLSHLSYLGLAFLLSVFLMTFHSQFIWDNFPLIQITQFPWRLLVFSATFTAFFTGSIAYLIKNTCLLKYLTLAIIITTIALNFNYFKPEKPTETWALYTTDRQTIRSEVSDALFDFLPVAAQKPNQSATSPYETTAQISHFITKPGFYSFSSSSQQPTQFYLNQYFFPGWQAQIDGQTIAIQPDSDLGRIQLTLPANQHQVQIKLDKTPLQHWADIISLLTWLGLAAYIFNLRKTYA